MTTQFKTIVYNNLLGTLLGGLTGFIVAELIIVGIDDFENFETIEEETDEEEEDSDKDEEEELEVLVKKIRSERSTVKPKVKRVNYQEYFKENQKPSLEKLVNKKKSGELMKQTVDAEPRALSIDEQTDLILTDLKVVSLRYYKGQGIAVNNDNDALMLDPEDVLGEENLKLFGQNGQEANELAVLDEADNTLYLVRKTGPKETYGGEEEEEELELQSMSRHSNFDDEEEIDDDEETDEET